MCEEALWKYNIWQNALKRTQTWVQAVAWRLHNSRTGESWRGLTIPCRAAKQAERNWLENNHFLRRTYTYVGHCDDSWKIFFWIPPLQKKPQNKFQNPNDIGFLSSMPIFGNLKMWYIGWYCLFSVFLDYLSTLFCSTWKSWYLCPFGKHTTQHQHS